MEMTDSKTVTVYTREDCHLCKDAITVIRTVAESVAPPVKIELIDIDEKESLQAKYGDRVPYVLIDDQPAFKYHVNKQELQEKLTC